MALLPTSVEYTNRDFDSIRERLFSLIKSVFPQWTDFDVANFGNLLVELFAHVGDVLGRVDGLGDLLRGGADVCEGGTSEHDLLDRIHVHQDLQGLPVYEGERPGVGGGGGRRRYEGAREGLRSLCRRANIRPISWHVLRHTFASHLVLRGIPLKAVQELFGHSTIEMTMRYAHLSPEVKRDAVAVLDAEKPVEEDFQGHNRGTWENFEPQKCENPL